LIVGACILTHCNGAERREEKKKKGKERLARKVTRSLHRMRRRTSRKKEKGKAVSCTTRSCKELRFKRKKKKKKKENQDPLPTTSSRSIRDCPGREEKGNRKITLPVDQDTF